MNQLKPMIIVLLMLTSTLAGCAGTDGEGERYSKNRIVEETGTLSNIFELSLKDNETVTFMYSYVIIECLKDIDKDPWGQNYCEDGSEIKLEVWPELDGGEMYEDVMYGGNYTLCTMKIPESNFGDGDGNPCMNSDPNGDWTLSKWGLSYVVVDSFQVSILESSHIKWGENFHVSQYLINSPGNLANPFHEEFCRVDMPSRQCRPYSISGNGSENLPLISLNDNQWMMIISHTAMMEVFDDPESSNSYVVPTVLDTESNNILNYYNGNSILTAAHIITESQQIIEGYCQYKCVLLDWSFSYYVYTIDYDKGYIHNTILSD